MAAEAAERELGDYLLERRLGEGRLCEVFLAYRKRGGTEPLALRRLRSELTLHQGAAALFLDEARRVSRVLHANVARVIDTGRDARGRPFVVEEHADGPSLAALRRALHDRQELLPIEACVDVAVQLSRALQGVHEREPDGAEPLAHGAVSARSVLLKRDGALKLKGFGSERVVALLSASTPGIVEPRLSSLAPEQLRGEDVDGRADQYALGVLLWELLTGRRLFHAPSAEATRDAVLGAPVPSPSTIRRGVPPALDAVVLRALERSREARFPDARALEHALEQVVPPVGVDDRETRLRNELERLSTSADGPAPAENGNAQAAFIAAGRAASFEVESGIAAGPGVDDGAAHFAARAIPLEGPVRSARAPVRGTRRRRSFAAAVLVLLVVAGVGFALWRYPDEMRELPVVGSWLPGEAPQRSAEKPLGPEPGLPPVAKPRSLADERRADRLEERAAELLLAGQNRRALQVLREAVELSPERASLHEKLAMAYRGAGERYLAKRHLERYRALAVSPSDRARATELLDELAAER